MLHCPIIKNVVKSIASIQTGCCLAAIFCFTSLSAFAADSRLVIAVKSGDAATVRTLLKNGADVNEPDVEGTTALHWAAGRDDVTIVGLLLGSGAKASVTNRYGISPMLVACNNAGSPVVEALLKAGADPNSAMPEGETAIMTAARAGKSEVIRALYRAGANINARESWHGQVATMWAASENHAETIEMLKELGADLNLRSDGGFTPLLFAVRDGQLDAVKVLLKLGANANDTIKPQKVAAARPRPTAFENSGAPKGYAINGVSGSPIRAAGPEGTSALVLAIMNANFEIAKYLLDHGADPNAAEQGWTPLHELEYVRRPNHGKGLPPPEPAGYFDTLELAKVLIEHGANVNARQTKEINDGQRNFMNRVGATPFLLAAKHADLSMMKLLAEHGADPNIPVEEGATALAAAAGVGIWNVGESAATNEEAFEAVKLAYELGCRDVNAADKWGYTAMHGAAFRGADQVAQFLAEKGAKLDPVTANEGWTPLRIAYGVYYTGTVKRADSTAALLAKLMKEQGLPVPPFKNDVDYGNRGPLRAP